MRKHDNWFRLDQLSGYKADIGDLEQACGPLCTSVDELVAAIPIDPLLNTPNTPFGGGMPDTLTQLYPGHQPAAIYPGESPNIMSAQLQYSPSRSMDDIQFNGHQLNPYDPFPGNSNPQYATQELPIPASGLFRPSPPPKIDQLNPHRPYQGIDQFQYAGQEHGIHLDGYLRSSPQVTFEHPPNPPQHNTYQGMDPIQYSVEQAGISLTDFLRSSPGNDLYQPAPYSPYAELIHIPSPHQAPRASIDELLRCNTHDLAMLEGPYAGVMQDTEYTYQGQFVSPSQISPSIPLMPQLAYDPIPVPDSPVDSLKTDEGIITQLNRFANQANHKKQRLDPNTWPRLDRCAVDGSPGRERIPFNVYDSQSHTLPDLPPVPPPVDTRPVPNSKLLDPISTAPSSSPPRPSPPQTKRARAVQNKPASPVRSNVASPVRGNVASPVRGNVASPVRGNVASPLRSDRAPPIYSETDPELSCFATMTSSVDYAQLNTDDLFGCMNLDELKSFAKKLQANPHTTRDMIIIGIKAIASNQSTLFGAPSTTTKGKQKKQLSLKFTKKGLKESQISSLNSRILKIIGPSIKLRPKVCSLFKRLHLIFYRSTTISEKTMTASMLAQMKIRNYPSYQVIRTSSIFDSREQLIKYEEALELEKQFDDLLVNERRPWNEDEQGKARRQEAKTLRLKKALDVFESAWMLWQITVCEENDRLEKLRPTQDLAYHDHDLSNYYKRRFHPGWPLTRILQKGLAVLARFEEHEREAKVLEALLQQPHFRRGKRGQWYDRLALVLMTHLARDESLAMNQRAVHMNSALYTCEHGLTDPDTHQLYRFSLGRRLARLQSLDPSIHHPSQTLLEVEEWKTARRTTIHRTIVNEDREVGAKTRWLSSLDKTPISVEEIALEHYISNHPGWRGFHSETGILKMIFSLVFWDIIFAAVPGAFETSFQTAPLDIATDAFRIVRRPLIEDRMRMIEERGSEEIMARMRETYARECGRKTWSIGISPASWARYSLEDLLQIVCCFSVQAFSLISNAFFEDWSVWAAGAPDLIIWNPYLNRCKFVEVKGPGDKLSEQQKNWFSLLLKAEGVEVEICSVKED
ncbi:hypothetical protein PtA15_2A700 [Puccinia triticina]|uniref:Fanconi-associated nuclease n=1 Tax=Puccinia triticina TaxID=208348 RepID=A0ABY7CBU5_9BASI|nr:uncharacterized protein PtA15_2A700 [Puccinia triticina]WAQ82383.1 hypothetical protein PtA15_2A700 [Puccinia triticina]